MGQTNAKRIQVILRETVTTPINDDRQPVAKTAFFKVGDTVDVIDEDANGNIVSTARCRCVRKGLGILKMGNMNGDSYETKFLLQEGVRHRFS